MLGIANKCAQQLAIRTAVLLRSDALPDSYGNLCTSSSDTLLAEQADGGFECEGWTEQLWVSATAQLTLSFSVEHSLQNVLSTMFNQARELVSLSFSMTAHELS